MTKGPNKDRNKNALIEARTKEAQLTSQQREDKRIFIGIQKDYRNAYRMRLYKGAQLDLIREELKKAEDICNHQIRFLWEGMPYSKDMLAVFHDAIQDEFFDYVEKEKYYKLKLETDYNMNQEQINAILTGLSKDFLKEAPNWPGEEYGETTIDKNYFG